MSFLVLFTSSVNYLLFQEVSLCLYYMKHHRYTLTLDVVVVAVVLVKGDSELVIVILNILTKITDPHLMIGMFQRGWSYFMSCYALGCRMLQWTFNL